MMWNFTGQAVLIPNVEGLENILQDEDASVKPQENMLRLNPNDFSIQSDQARKDVSESAVDAFLLEVLDDALNKLPPSRKKRTDITESEVDSFISNADWNTQARYKIKVQRILTLILIEVHLQRVMSMFYLYLLRITTQLLVQ